MDANSFRAKSYNKPETSRNCAATYPEKKLINIQPIEKLDYNEQGILEVHSIFHTIQGEGPFAGKPAIFIRLAGCNLQCPGCDTEYTANRKVLTIEDILNVMHTFDASNTYLVVITGGEPMRQNITPLVRLLLRNGLSVQIETNGTLPPSPGLLELQNLVGRENTASRILAHALSETVGLYIVVSPKTDHVNARIEEAATAFKYVVDVENGTTLSGYPRKALGNKVRAHVATPPSYWCGPVYIQPRDQHNELLNAANLELAKAVCMKYGHTLQLQVHKIIGVE
jgi:7-carboxy-7-deazaguanine synthase